MAGNPFTTIETWFGKLVAGINGLTAAIATATPTTQSQPANSFLASPSGSSGTPTFRAITTADIETAGDARYAQKAGSAAQVFQVADATSANEAVAFEQVSGVVMDSFFGTAGYAANTNYDATVTFTPARAGKVIICGAFYTNGGTFPASVRQQIIVDGTVIVDDGGITGWTMAAAASLSANVSHTVGLRLSYGATGGTFDTYIRGFVLFIPTP